MKKIFRIAAGAIIVLAFSFFYAHIDKNTYLYDRNIDSSLYSNTGIIYEKKELTQNFLCESDVLDGMNVKCSVAGDVQNVTVEYKFTDADTEEVVAEGSISALEIDNNKFNYFPIEQLTNTKGKEYTFSIQEEGSQEGTGIIFYSVGEEKNRPINVNGEKGEGVLVARVVSAQFDFETFIVVVLFAIYLIAFIRFLYKLFM